MLGVGTVIRKSVPDWIVGLIGEKSKALLNFFWPAQCPKSPFEKFNTP